MENNNSKTVKIENILNFKFCYFFLNHSLLIIVISFVKNFD